VSCRRRWPVSRCGLALRVSNARCDARGARSVAAGASRGAVVSAGPIERANALDAGEAPPGARH